MVYGGWNNSVSHQIFTEIMTLGLFYACENSFMNMKGCSWNLFGINLEKMSAYLNIFSNEGIFMNMKESSRNVCSAYVVKMSADLNIFSNEDIFMNMKDSSRSAYVERWIYFQIKTFSWISWNLYEMYVMKMSADLNIFSNEGIFMNMKEFFMKCVLFLCIEDVCWLEKIFMYDR